jgi:hypothetical protein
MHDAVGLQRSATQPTQPARRPRRTAGRPRPAGLATAPAVRPLITACSPPRATRGWVVLTVVMTALAALALGLLFGTAATDDGVPDGITLVEVHRGESLWELARRVVPDGPPEAVVARIRALNRMSGSTLHPGQPLLVPDAGSAAAPDTPN